jgi:hypothetical protein
MDLLPLCLWIIMCVLILSVIHYPECITPQVPDKPPQTVEDVRNQADQDVLKKLQAVIVFCLSFLVLAI